MGNRVAEMTEPGCKDSIGWCVFQSCSMACFSPIFHDQLSAELFAQLLGDIYPLWNDSELECLQGVVVRVVQNHFGREPELNMRYQDYLANSVLTGNLLAEIRRQLRVAVRR
jgi:hypothetical protein